MELFWAQPPMYLMTGRGGPIQLATDAAHFRRLCDVHLNRAGAVVFIVRSARANHDESVEAAFHSAEASKGEMLHNVAGGGV
jgi:hypothetical protein